ncbi:phage portal protein [Micromonospora krabiensis]|uniref:Phage portal protein, SPP1 Gp6-like n=1 Tax=Micromonospora krabiensis TaxID=307121 RepID=A0A1C3N5S0_9ACTN|nr:phage portal protein [Micromonospora krabiensis]SBV27925.1 Phage portal protein, SPP1 Gp6-like [Micromonospora krabiensis]
MTQPVDTSAKALAQLLLGIINEDRERFDIIDRYVSGDHDDPYMPPGADAEYKLLAKRAVTNLIPLLIGTPAQALFVDSFRRGNQNSSDDDQRSLPEWEHWQASRLDARQGPIYHGALKYGHSFTLTEKDIKGRVLTKGLSAYNTAAVYVDPANDIDPFAALTIVRPAEPKAKEPAARRGVARLWDGKFEYRVTFASPTDLESVRVEKGVAHGLDECPVTRFAASVDLEGRTVGVVEPNKGLPGVQAALGKYAFEIKSYADAYLIEARDHSEAIGRRVDWDAFTAVLKWRGGWDVVLNDELGDGAAGNIEWGRKVEFYDDETGLPMGAMEGLHLLERAVQVVAVRHRSELRGR